MKKKLCSNLKGLIDRSTTPRSSLEPHHRYLLLTWVGGAPPRVGTGII